MYVDANPLVLALQGFKRRVEIEVFSEGEGEGEDTYVDPSNIALQVQRIGSSDTSATEILYEDDLTAPPVGGSRIERTDTGRYHIVWTSTDTATKGRYLFVWSVQGPSGTEEVQRVQTVEVISAFTMDRIRAFREQIDKMRKQVNVSPTDFCPLGYTDGQLLEYLRGGMTLINAYQPYPTWCSVDTFPDTFRQTLFDAALVVGVNAQTLFAIDNDLDNWSSQGNSFVVLHQPKLAAFSQTLTARLDVLIPKMKLHFVRSGSAKVEVGPNTRLSTIVGMSPNGATFRNMYTR